MIRKRPLCGGLGWLDFPLEIVYKIGWKLKTPKNQSDSSIALRWSMDSSVVVLQLSIGAHLYLRDYRWLWVDDVDKSNVAYCVASLACNSMRLSVADAANPCLKKIT
jgi:hypothetical protein